MSSEVKEKDDNVCVNHTDFMGAGDDDKMIMI